MGTGRRPAGHCAPSGHLGQAVSKRSTVVENVPAAQTHSHACALPSRRVTRSTGHAAHTADPGCGASVPIAHGWHVVRPAPSAYQPGGHAEHRSDPANGVALPCVQGSHVVCRALGDSPGPHCAEHDVRPSSITYGPPHTAQVTPSAVYACGAHRVHCAAPAAAAAAPAGQGWHASSDVAPWAGWNDPGGHRVQFSAEVMPTCSPTRPAGHGAQSAAAVAPLMGP